MDVYSSMLPHELISLQKDDHSQHFDLGVHFTAQPDLYPGSDNTHLQHHRSHLQEAVLTLITLIAFLLLSISMMPGDPNANPKNVYPPQILVTTRTSACLIDITKIDHEMSRVGGPVYLNDDKLNKSPCETECDDCDPNWIRAASDSGYEGEGNDISSQDPGVPGSEKNDDIVDKDYEAQYPTSARSYPTQHNSLPPQEPATSAHGDTDISLDVPKTCTSIKRPYNYVRRECMKCRKS